MSEKITITIEVDTEVYEKAAAVATNLDWPIDRVFNIGTGIALAAFGDEAHNHGNN